MGENFTAFEREFPVALPGGPEGTISLYMNECVEREKFSGGNERIRNLVVVHEGVTNEKKELPVNDVCGMRRLTG